MELRPYQAECIETIEAQPPGAFLAQMATGLKQSNLIETRGRANTKGKRINGIPTECFCLRLPTVELDDEADPDEQPL